jgi:hypothetical protein
MTRRGLTTVALAVTALCAALLAGPAAASWTAPPIGVSPPGQNVSEPEAAVGPDGIATVVWPGDDDRIWAARRSPNGAWSPPQALSEGSDSENPHVAAGPGGTAVAVWHEWSAGRVMSRRFSGAV